MEEMVGEKPGPLASIYQQKSGASEFLKQLHDSSKDISLVKFS